jgi:hypothetical protein
MTRSRRSGGSKFQQRFRLIPKCDWLTDSRYTRENGRSINVATKSHDHRSDNPYDKGSS